MSPSTSPSRLGCLLMVLGALHGCHGDPPAREPQRSRSASTSGSGIARTDLEDRYGSARPVEALLGRATYYGDSLAGNRTASGEIYDPAAFTAAHRKLPFGTIVRVVRLDTGGAAYARITDRGPFGDARRIIDLSRAAAERLDMIVRGVVDVRVEILEYPR